MSLDLVAIAEQLRASVGIAAKADIGTVATHLGLAAQAISVGDDCAAIPDGMGFCCLRSKASSTNSWPQIRGSPVGAVSWSISRMSRRWAETRGGCRCGLGQRGGRRDPRAGRHARSVGRIWRPDRRRTYEYQNRSWPVVGRDPRAGQAVVDQLRRQAGRPADRRHRPSRTLPRTFQQLGGSHIGATRAPAR